MLIRPGLFDREPLHEWVKRKCFFCGMPFEKHDREPCPTLESGYQLNLLIPANGHSRDYRRKCRHFKDIRCGIPAWQCPGCKDEMEKGAVYGHYTRRKARVLDGGMFGGDGAGECEPVEAIEALGPVPQGPER